jgi:peptide deformylase
MTIRTILNIPDPKLKLVSEPVTVFDDALQTLVQDMLETMYDAPGIGLAAIQIGVAKRLLVIDLAKEEELKAPMVFANPEIISVSDELSSYEEGCLSIPDYYESVERPASLKIKYQTEKGESREMEADGLLATCLQHEIDHLNGIMFIDHISKLKRSRVITKFTKAARFTKDVKRGELIKESK